MFTRVVSLKFTFCCTLFSKSTLILPVSLNVIKTCCLWFCWSA